MLEPALILLDEPTSALDRTVQKQVVDLLRQLQIKHGLTYLFISHDLAVVHALAHDLLVIKDGKVVEQGSSREIFAAPTHPYTQELLKASGLKPAEAPCGSELARESGGADINESTDTTHSRASSLPQF